jgi:hypothetical protein
MAMKLCTNSAAVEMVDDRFHHLCMSLLYTRPNDAPTGPTAKHFRSSCLQADADVSGVW